MKKIIIISNLSVLIFLLISISQTGIPDENQNLNLKVSIFQIPPIQSIVKSESSTRAKEGGIVGEQIGGAVTSSFPDGGVLFKSDIFHSNTDIIRFIKSKTRSTFPEFVSILPIADLRILVNTENLKTSITEEKVYPQRNKHLIVDYLLQVLPLSIQNEEAVFKLRFSAKYKVAEGDKKKLFDQILGLVYSRTFIVGFPTNDNSGRGTVYWLAFSFEDEYPKKIEEFELFLK